MTQAASLSDRLSRELPELLELRRHLHAHPELSGEEHQTAALVAGELPCVGQFLLCKGWTAGKCGGCDCRCSGG